MSGGAGVGGDSTGEGAVAVGSGVREGWIPSEASDATAPHASALIILAIMAAAAQVVAAFTGFPHDAVRVPNEG